MTAFETYQQKFADLVPDLEHLAKAQFADLDPEARTEAAQNSIGLAWKAYRALIKQGRGDDPGIIKSCLWYAIKQTRAGRMPQGQCHTQDALEARRNGKVMFERMAIDSFIEDRTPVPDVVSFRIDVPAFLQTLPERRQRMSYDLMAGMTTGEAADKYKVSAGAISQFRRRFMEHFQEFMSK